MGGPHLFITNYNVIPKLKHTMAKGFGIWFEGRNTPVTVSASSRGEAVKKAKASGRAGSKGKVVKARELSDQERKTAAKGWLRTRADGSNPTGSKESRAKAAKFKSKFRSGPAKQSKAK